MTLPAIVRPPLLDRPAWQRFSFAAVLLAAAIVAGRVADSPPSQPLTLLSSYVAVTITMWLCGVRAALGVAAGGLAGALWPNAAGGDWLVPLAAEGVVGVLLYVFACGTTLCLWETLRVAERRHAQQLELQVAARTAELHRTIADLETFSYTLVHDMRAPLRSIRLFIQMLSADAASGMPCDAAAQLHRIDQTAARMDRLIVDVLDYSRLTRRPIEFRPVDLDQLVRDLIASQPGFAPEKADIHLEAALPRVHGNEALLSQCFSNLLQNATKFVEPGVKPRIRILATHHDSFVRVTVEDNGIGVPSDATERIFEPFQREDARYDGSGIGLAIVRKVIERLGGRVGVESRLGHGSRFWIELPAAEEGSSPNTRGTTPDGSAALSARA